MDRPFIVAIAGGSGSGKTTTANQLVELLAPEGAVLLSEDNYYRDSRNLPGFDPTTYDFDALAARDHDLLHAHLMQLRSGQPVDVPDYCFVSHGRKGSRHSLAPKAVIVLEGIHCLCNEALLPLYDMTCFVDTPDDIRFIRRLLRDRDQRGRRTDDIVAQYLATVRPAHERWIGPSHMNAHMTVSGGDGLRGPDSPSAFGAAAQIAAAVRRALASSGQQ
jgi:uridine kinase